MSYRNKKLLASAKDQPCVLCGSVGTTIAAHANSVALGKGMGIKAPDFYTAWVCHSCHDRIDGRAAVGWAYTSNHDMWVQAYIRTVARWFELGIVVVR